MRAALGPDPAIYVLNGLLPGSDDAFAAHDLRPVLGSMAEIAQWRALCGARAPLPAALHVDTGMNRLGIRVEEALALAADPGIPLALVMTHMACADEPGHPLNAEQIARFATVRAAFPGVAASLANSAGIQLGADYHFDLVRPGIALYGGAFSEDRPPLDVVATAKARIVQVRDVAAGGAPATRISGSLQPPDPVVVRVRRAALPA